ILESMSTFAKNKTAMEKLCGHLDHARTQVVNLVSKKHESLLKLPDLNVKNVPKSGTCSLADKLKSNIDKINKINISSTMPQEDVENFFQILLDLTLIDDDIKIEEQIQFMMKLLIVLNAIRDAKSMKNVRTIKM
ncbi:MAG: hypothetical protein MHPSP_003806, partial [Paramarteilia canceri]